MTWLEAPCLKRFPWLVHGFSTRLGLAGQNGKDDRRAAPAGLDLGTHGARQPRAILANRREFFVELGAGGFTVAALQQIHSAEIWQAQHGSAGTLEYRPAGYRLPPNARRREHAGDDHAGDALLSSEAGILLTMRVADCLPVLLAGPRQRVIAAVHAGWRGSMRRVIEKTVGEMRRIFGCEPPSLFVVLGPSIRGCCYEVGEDVVDAFRGSFPRAERFFCKSEQPASSPAGASFLSTMPPGHGRPAGSGLNLDLVAVAFDQLESAGVPKSRIQVVGFCTACRNDLFFSYRREGSSAGRMMGVIGLRAPSTSN